MATTKNYKDFILEQLDLLEDFTCKPMMGEYLLYYKDILFGGIYDDLLLVQIVSTNEKYKMKTISPYKNARLMYLVDDIDNKEELREIVLNTCKGLSK